MDQRSPDKLAAHDADARTFERRALALAVLAPGFARRIFADDGASRCG